MAGPASHPEPIAIIGSACHFAGEVSSPSKLWDLLREPGDLRSEISDSRFSSRGFYHADHTQPGHSNVRHSYLLSEDPALFDAEFFGIKPVEAKAIDPQQRWLLETVYEVTSCFSSLAPLPGHAARSANTKLGHRGGRPHHSGAQG